MANVSFNGKFLSATPSGVHRVAGELISALGRLIDHDEQLARAIQGEILTPKDAVRKVEQVPFKHRKVGHLTWQLWEQIELPLYARDSLLISLCNLSSISKTNAITMIHDAQVFSSPESYSPWFRKWYQFALPKIGKANRSILTVSNYSKDQLEQWGIASKNKVEVIHNGVEHIMGHAPDDSVLKRLKLQPGDYALGLANVQTHKNIKLIIDAHSSPELQDHKLVLFGNAGKEDFEALGVSVPQNVVFTGIVGDRELRSLMEHANALAFPSLTEGFGLPPLEAMLLGTPAICAPCGALPEVCGDMTTYVDPNDVAGWADAIYRISTEESHVRQNRVQAARQHAARFTWDAASRRLADIAVNCIRSQEAA